MKKLVCLLAVLMLLATSAMAETVDLSKMDDVALEKLLTEVQQEVVARGIEKSCEFKQGTYLCGVDIPEGTYNVELGELSVFYEPFKMFTADMEGNDTGCCFGKESTSGMVKIRKGEKLYAYCDFKLTVFVPKFQ